MAQTMVGIVNITGYVGSELARLLVRHPEIELKSVTGRSSIGQKVATVFPHLNSIDLNIDAELGKVDLAFSALPHNTSSGIVSNLLKQGVRVIDASADFRLKDAAEYPKWYDFQHPSSSLLAEAVYGLPELHRGEIAPARLVANPGCYSTSAILALAPAVREGIIEGHIVIDGKSGVSGAGRTPSLTTHFSEANENVSAYGISGHRHLPEITQELNALKQGNTLSLTFLPHLIPMTRGLMVSCYGQLKHGGLPSTRQGSEELLAIYRDFYRTHPFVEVVDHLPQTKQAYGTNLCLVHPTIDLRTNTLIIVSCLDNLIKGGAGQALQNMNLMLDIPEITGLDALAVYP